jgi:hypothetical protein
MAVRIGWALMLAGASAAGCHTQRRTEPTPEVPYADVLQVAQELGMHIQRDRSTQALILEDPVNRIVVAPGLTYALVNGQYVDLGWEARTYQGRLIMPAEGVRRITKLLKSRPAHRAGAA